ncbi:hypothetical protein [Paracraurococcus ruber]|uniref:Lipoprotein n=1 Tax=Paracraurococcus ruber TaxID=77675 RepID=A0ABS1CVK9_9PROT|nr:hypothetical protein [Paracraurococcus ruber]MBK1657754.1 hypothetical protein [Paracraurococcus ruber]TDG30526.1 hypothetical protein E2C05_14105 [Paracraurococcus ruber]
MRAWPLVVLPLLVGCATGGGCETVLANASGRVVEQVYLARAGEAWGRDLAAPGQVAPGGTLPLRFAGQGSHALRIVWADGRAAEMPAVEACKVQRITVRDTELVGE